jgi:hypothetical protein
MPADLAYGSLLNAVGSAGDVLLASAGSGRAPVTSCRPGMRSGPPRTRLRRPARDWLCKYGSSPLGLRLGNRQ